MREDHRIGKNMFNNIFLVGCHMVALNYQFGGEEMNVNRVKFLVFNGSFLFLFDSILKENQRSGYLLKPPSLTHDCPPASPVRISVKLLGARYLFTQTYTRRCTKKKHN